MLFCNSDKTKQKQDLEERILLLRKCPFDTFACGWTAVPKKLPGASFISLSETGVVESEKDKLNYYFFSVYVNNCIE